MSMRAERLARMGGAAVGDGVDAALGTKGPGDPKGSKGGRDSRGGDRIQRKRACRAALIAALMLGSLIGILAWQSSCGDGAAEMRVGAQEPGSYAGQFLDDVIGASSASGGTTLRSALEGLGFTLLSGRDAPAWIASEVIDVGEYAEAYMDATGSVIGLMMDEPADSAFAHIRDQLNERGWAMSQTGIDNSATFAKSEGECRWILLSCVQASEGEASAVLHIQRA